MARHDVTVRDGGAAGISVGSVEPEHALFVLAEGESARDHAVYREQATARAQVDGSAEDDVSQLETVAVEAIEIKGAIAATAHRVGAGMRDRERREDDDPVFIARGFRTRDEDTVGIVVAARRRDARVGERERGDTVEAELQAAGSVAVGVDVDRTGSQAGGADVAEHEAPFRDKGAAVVKVVSVQDQHAAFALTQVLRAGAPGPDHAVDRHQAVGRGVRIIVADVEVEIASRPEVRRDRTVEDEIEIGASVGTEAQDTVISGVTVTDDEPSEQQG